MEVSPLNECFQLLGSQAVKVPQSFDKYFIVWTVRIEFGNFLVGVIFIHHNLPSGHQKMASLSSDQLVIHPADLSLPSLSVPQL